MARKRSTGGVSRTRLEAFIRANGLTPAELAREASVSRQHLLRIRKGLADPTLMLALPSRDACGRLLVRTVTIGRSLRG